ncbi:MAG: hypothetical protein GWM90_09845, partial [Gemmatimonadetes bacterium]|nr:hypothetical protein [Gemmatimonadota bacterium]NIQ53753.1 hypothetical protein [Gemmatimonadota bacterium]NIU73932.1 hypothetical protein [Gammaproteobacteria bacterium]NIX44405.1 hypothetical protein [Gemmatimonadota bacterium]NIY08624.1 hypothetical protein [Gemmatimonadota bacterium]
MAAEALTELAARYGVHMSYRDADGRTRDASADALVAVLQALGAELNGPADAPDALRRRMRDEHRRPMEPVVVRWTPARGENGDSDERAGDGPEEPPTGVEL